MIIVDSQIHIWAPETPEKPWALETGSKPHWPEPLGHEELLRELDQNGVRRAILVPPTWEGDRNDTSLDAARLHPDRLAVMGRLPLDDPQNRERVATWKEQPGMLGIRAAFHRGAAQGWLDDGTVEWFWEAAERHQVPVMAYAPQAMPKLGEVARRHPGLRLIIDHMGLGKGLEGKDLSPAVETLIGLADRSNIAVKASALPCYAADGYPFRSLQPHIRRVIDAFGPQRVFWGSDFSRLSRVPCTYPQALTLFTEELGDLSVTDKEWIMGRAIAEWLDWPLEES